MPRPPDEGDNGECFAIICRCVPVVIILIKTGNIREVRGGLGKRWRGVEIFGGRVEIFGGRVEIFGDRARAWNAFTARSGSVFSIRDGGGCCRGAARWLTGRSRPAG